MRRAGLDPEAVAVHVVEGRPAEEIVAVAERIGADLIAMGTRGQNLVEQAVVGSVSGAVLRAAPCSVLVVGDPPRARR